MYFCFVSIINIGSNIIILRFNNDVKLLCVQISFNRILPLAVGYFKKVSQNAHFRRNPPCLKFQLDQFLTGLHDGFAHNLLLDFPSYCPKALPNISCTQCYLDFLTLIATKLFLLFLYLIYELLYIQKMFVRIFKQNMYATKAKIRGYTLRL